MDKLKMHTPNLSDEKYAALAEMFPNAVTETVDDNGAVIRAIDKDVLIQEINTHVVEGREERYQFTWPDKRKSVLLANAPIAAALRPCREESVDFDNTENLYIEGDNLDVLKLLRETYLNRVKMIYIDPPYNTGSDLLYDDDFTECAASFFNRDIQYDEQGNRLAPNLNSNGRFHTDWLNTIYPRLHIARDLLTSDGVIFMSIDDSESANLRKACDEIFGRTNFVADICVVNNLKGRNDKKYIARANERMLMYVKSQDFTEHGLPVSESTMTEYNKSDTKGIYRHLELRKRGGPDTRAERPNMYYPFYVNPNTGEVSLERTELYSIEALPVKSNGVDGRWRWGRETAQKNIEYIVGREVGNKYNIYEKDYYESEDGARRVRPKSVLSGSAYSTDVATKEYRAIMDEIDFSNPKPVAMLKDLIEYSINPNDDAIVLDFFSGSATTAHAVMQLNAEDGGKRKFIMVQIPENCDVNSKAYKTGYPNICEIGKERIRRAGQKIKDEAGLTAQNLDIGFRVLKLDSSNMKDVYYTPEELAQTNFDFEGFTDNIKADRSGEDLLFQVMLDLGIPLSAKITQEGGLWCVNDNYLIACFERVDTDLITEIAKKKPFYAVFRDSSFANDSAMVNFEQVFSTYSPNTIRRVL